MNGSVSPLLRTVTICFRTSEKLQQVLREIGDEERRSVSSIIEHTLFQYVEERGRTLGWSEEKRRHERRQVAAPALVTCPGSDRIQAGIVLDVSLGGIRISVAGTFECRMREDEEPATISITFTLPETKKALTVLCVPKHILPYEDRTTIGACFTDADFATFQGLQDYLVGPVRSAQKEMSSGNGDNC
jgi:hypothetical protein